jgi:hypothetical protein
MFLDFTNVSPLAPAMGGMPGCGIFACHVDLP